MNITLDFKNASRNLAPDEANIVIPIITDDETEFARVISDIANDYCIRPSDFTEHYIFACEYDEKIEVYISINPDLDLIFVDRYNGNIDDNKQIEEIILNYINSSENKEDL